MVHDMEVALAEGLAAVAAAAAAAAITNRTGGSGEQQQGEEEAEGQPVAVTAAATVRQGNEEPGLRQGWVLQRCPLFVYKAGGGVTLFALIDWHQLALPAQTALLGLGGPAVGHDVIVIVMLHNKPYKPCR